MAVAEFEGYVARERDKLIRFVDYGGKASLDGVRETPSNPPPTLSDQGIDKNLAKRSRRVARMAVGEFEDYVAKERDKLIRFVEKQKDGCVRGDICTGKNEWYTPAEYVEAARLSADVPSAAWANSWRKCRRLRAEMQCVLGVLKTPR